MAQTAASPSQDPITPVEQVASIIGVLPLVQRLRAFGPEHRPAGIVSTEEMSIRQQIAEAVLTASLDLDGVLAEIDFERAQILEVRQQLSDKRDRKVKVLTLASIIIGTAPESSGRRCNSATSWRRGGLDSGRWLLGWPGFVHTCTAPDWRNGLPGACSEHAGPNLRPDTGTSQRISERRLDLPEHRAG